jgi:hypothetical protein
LEAIIFLHGVFVGCYFGFLASVLAAHMANRPPSQEQIRKFLEE